MAQWPQLTYAKNTKQNITILANHYIFAYSSTNMYHVSPKDPISFDAFFFVHGTFKLSYTLIGFSSKKK